MLAKQHSTTKLFRSYFFEEFIHFWKRWVKSRLLKLNKAAPNIKWKISQRGIKQVINGNEAFDINFVARKIKKIYFRNFFVCYKNSMNSSNLRKYTIRINRWRFVSCCFLVTPFFMMQSFVLISVSPFLFPLIYIITLSRRISFRNNFSTSFSKDFDDPVIVWSVLKRTFRMKNKKIDCDCESQLYHITFSTTTTQTPTKI